MKNNSFLSKLLLGLIFCFSMPQGIFAQEAQMPSLDQLTPEQMKFLMEQQREELEQLLSEVREHTSNISFCIQQLQQQIQNDKISCKNDKEKVAILTELQKIKELTEALLKNDLISAQFPIIKAGTILNQIITTYLLPKIQKDLTSIKHEELDTLIRASIQKKVNDLQPEQIIELLKQNKKHITELDNITTSIGLTWYNKAYRGFNNWYGPTILKYTGLAAATGCLLGLAGAYTHDSLPSCITDKEWFKNWIAQPIPAIEKNGKLVPAVVDPRELPLFQNWTYTINKLQSAGILAMGAVYQLDLKSWFNSLYGEKIATAQKESVKALEKAHKFCLGVDITQREKELDQITFDDMTDVEELKEIAITTAKFMKNPERYERAGINAQKGILLYGAPGTGKTLFAAALRNMINEEINENGKGKKVEFIDATKILQQFPSLTIEALFWNAQHMAPCIIFFDEVDLTGAHRDKNAWTTTQLLTAMDGMEPTKQIVVIGATNKEDQLDSALGRSGRFDKQIYIKTPKFKGRVTFIAKELQKHNIAIHPELIIQLAEETQGCSYADLKKMLHAAFANATNEMRIVTEEDFDKALDTEIRKIKPNTEISIKKKETIAIYQAGKAVARHLLQTHNTVVKVTTNPIQLPIKAMEKYSIDTEDKSDNKKHIKSKSPSKEIDGDVFTKLRTPDNDLLSDKDQELEAMALLAGNAAHQLLLNTTYSSCNPQDRAQAMDIIYSLISQGEEINDKTKEKALELKKTYEEQIVKLLDEHKDLLLKVIKILMTQGTIDRYEWAELVTPQAEQTTTETVETSE